MLSDNAEAIIMQMIISQIHIDHVPKCHLWVKSQNTKINWQRKINGHIQFSEQNFVPDFERQLKLSSWEKFRQYCRRNWHPMWRMKELWKVLNATASPKLEWVTHDLLSNFALLFKRKPAFRKTLSTESNPSEVSSRSCYSQIQGGNQRVCCFYRVVTSTQLLQQQILCVVVISYLLGLSSKFKHIKVENLNSKGETYLTCFGNGKRNFLFFASNWLLL